MKIADYIVIAILLFAFGCAVTYIVKAKKSGRKCIGCPHSNTCSSNSGCSCGEKNGASGGKNESVSNKRKKS